MKRYLLISAIAVLSLMFVLPSCGGQKKAVDSNYGEVEINIPFNTPEYKTSKDFIRARSQGVSPDQATAKKIAMLNCRQEIAASMEALIKSVTEQYINQLTIADKQEYAAKFQQKAIETVKISLNGSNVIGEKLFRAKDGKYTYHIAMEMSKAPIKEEIAKAITSDEKLSLEFDKYMFDKTFDAEMAKLEQQQK